MSGGKHLHPKDTAFQMVILPLPPSLQLSGSDCIIMIGPALKAGLSGVDNTTVQEFKSLLYPYHSLINDPI